MDREKVISDLKSWRDDVQSKDNFIIMYKENALQMIDDVLAMLKEQDEEVRKAYERGMETGRTIKW